jgi:hypothetical protein
LRGAQPYRRAKDFPAPNHRATDRGSIPPLLKLTMPRATLAAVLGVPAEDIRLRDGIDLRLEAVASRWHRWQVIDTSRRRHLRSIR